ncbi:hypothetical protein CKM354_001042300 [Cercospora kikuchii]|uniref:Uncharacterized protein n=1 Tax=Cercospora kikuchii TaxID=84275 RepID=A0A9P3FH37_9PEZI|nr:uncharacterized protein CKM354_001042300 [Cercospora kikuchii]GIZ47328.1 hypothetical protein CKM354_001042300 [Cercospora kikuchii]
MADVEKMKAMVDDGSVTVDISMDEEAEEECLSDELGTMIPCSWLPMGEEEHAPPSEADLSHTIPDTAPMEAGSHKVPGLLSMPIDEVKKLKLTDCLTRAIIEGVETEMLFDKMAASDRLKDENGRAMPQGGRVAEGDKSVRYRSITNRELKELAQLEAAARLGTVRPENHAANPPVLSDDEKMRTHIIVGRKFIGHALPKVAPSLGTVRPKDHATGSPVLLEDEKEDVKSRVPISQEGATVEENLRSIDEMLKGYTAESKELKSARYVDIDIAADEFVALSSRSARQDRGMPSTLQDGSILSLAHSTGAVIALVFLVALMVSSFVRGSRNKSRRREEVETTFRQRVATARNLQQCHDALDDRNLALEDHKKLKLERDERRASPPVYLRLAGFALVMGSYFLAERTSAYFASHEILSWHLLPAVLALSVLSAVSLFRYQAETNNPVYEDTRTDGRVTTTFANLAFPINDAFTAMKEELQTKFSELQEGVKATLARLANKLESFTVKDLPLQSILTQTPAYILVFQTLFINISRSISPALNPDNLPEAEQDHRLMIMTCATFVLTLAGPAMLLCERPLWNWSVNLSRDSRDNVQGLIKPLINTSLYNLSIIWRLLALDLTISYFACTPPIVGTILGDCYTSFFSSWEPLFEVFGITSGFYFVFVMGRIVLDICGVVEEPLDVTSHESYESKKPMTAYQREFWRKYVEENVGAPMNESSDDSGESKKLMSALQREVWRKHVEESVDELRKASLEEEEREEEERKVQLEEAAKRALAAAVQVSEAGEEGDEGSEADVEDDGDDEDNEWSEVQKLETEAEVAEWELVPRTVSWHKSTRSDS